MQIFCVKPSVHYFDTFHEFTEEFEIKETDLILTETVMFRNYVEKENLPAKIVLKDEYDPGEPKEEVIDAILKEMAGLNIKRVIGIGGGSVIDIAKLLIVKDAYPVADVMYGRKDAQPDKELVIIPSTCGTGSEVTFGGIVTMKDTGFKTGILDSRLSSNQAVLIPEMISSLPMKIFMHCSVDALGHSMESFVSATRGNEIARAVGARSIKLILDGYAELAVRGEEAKPELLKNFIIASCLGGMAVNNGGAGPAHALAYPVGEVYHMSHGESIYQFLTPLFMHYEKTADGPLLEELRQIIRPALDKAGIEYDNVFEGMEKLFNKVYPARKLSEAGMKESDVEPFVKNVFAAKQRLLAASYCSFTEEDAAAIYRARL